MVAYLQGFGHRLLASNGWDVIRVGQACANLDSCYIWNCDESAMVISAVQADHDHFIVEFTDLAQFDIRFESQQVRISIDDDCVSEESIDHLLADQIWPRIIAHSNQLVVHGAAIVLPLGALILIGASGSGKSTLAASFHQAGYGLLGDDAMVVSTRDRTAFCRAVYPSLRLFPDTIDMLFGRSEDYSPVAHYTDKRNMHLYPEARPPVAEVPILGMLFLASPDERPGVTLRPLAVSRTCVNVIEHSFWLNPKDMDRTTDKLRQASQLAEFVPALEISYPRNFAGLPDLHETVLNHFGIAGRSETPAMRVGSE